MSTRRWHKYMECRGNYVWIYGELTPSVPAVIAKREPENTMDCRPLYAVIAQLDRTEWNRIQ